MHFSSKNRFVRFRNDFELNSINRLLQQQHSKRYERMKNLLFLVFFFFFLKTLCFFCEKEAEERFALETEFHKLKMDLEV